MGSAKGSASDKKNNRGARVLFITVSIVAFGFMIFMLSLKRAPQAEPVSNETSSQIIIEKAQHKF